MGTSGRIGATTAGVLCLLAATALHAESGGLETAWARNGRSFDGLPGRAAGTVVAGNLTGGGALSELAEMSDSPKAEKKEVPSPKAKPGYWQYNDYSHSTGESIGMLALDMLAWLIAPVVVLLGALGVLFSFLRPK